MASRAMRRYHPPMSQMTPHEVEAIARAVGMLASMAGAGIAVFVAIRSTHGAKTKKRV